MLMCEIQPLERFLDFVKKVPQDLKLLEKLIEYCQMFDVEQLGQIFTIFAEFNSIASESYDLVMKLRDIESSEEFKFNGLLASDYWAVKEKQEIELHAGS